MGQSPFRSIFIPSILAAGVTFTAITLPLSLSQSVPRWVALGSLQRQDIPVPEQSIKPVIRYIGMSIVASVIAGVAAAELLRRWQKRPAPPVADQSTTQSTLPEWSTASPEPLAHLSEGKAGVSLDELLALVDTHAPSSTGPIIDNEPSAPTETSNPDKPVLPASKSLAEIWHDCPVERLIFPDQVIPLHVRVPIQQETQDSAITNASAAEHITFAIAHRGQYYCLAHSTYQLAALKHWFYADQLSASQLSPQETTDVEEGRDLANANYDDYVITQQDDLFMVWQHQPAALPLDESPAHNLTVLPQRTNAVSAWLAS